LLIVHADFVPTPGAQGFQLSNPSAVDLSCLSATLSIFEKTNMTALRSKSLLLTAYAEHQLHQILGRCPEAFEIITPSDPLQRGAQLSLLLREELFEDVATTLEDSGIICDKRKPGVIRVAPTPLYNTFSEVWNFMRVFERAITAKREQTSQPEVMAQL
jgi:kynureninase